MDPREIERLGAEAFVRPLEPLKRWPHRMRDWPVVGLDTEYTPKGELVCWQIADTRGGSLYRAKREPLTVESLADATRAERGTHSDVVVVCYWSLAELQHLPVFARAVKIREYARGSLDCTLEAEDGTRLHVYDIARFFDRLSLRNAAASLGFEKHVYDVTRVSHSSLRDPKFRAYAITDAVITRDLFESVRNVWSGEGVDILRTRTPAACSAARFRGHYLTESFGCPQPAVRRLALRAAWGGRAEAFARGRWPRVYEYDLSSAYPSAVVALRVMPRARDWRPLRSWPIPERVVGGFARARFLFPRTCRYPCLPVFADGTLLYPRSGITFCTVAELRTAHALGARIQLFDGWAFASGSDDLARMMREVRARREACEDPALRTALKLQMNSLIGKFVQHRTTPGAADVETVANKLGVPLEALAGLSPTELLALGWRPACRIGSSWAPEVNALITGHVRAQLSRMIAATSPIYCATDAVWTTRELSRVPKGWELKRAGPGVVARTRLGVLDGKVVHHAWSVRAEAEKALESGEPRRHYRHNRPVHFLQALREHRRVGEWITEDRWGSTHWDHKRELLVDGSSRPWESVEAWRVAREALRE